MISDDIMGGEKFISESKCERGFTVLHRKMCSSLRTPNFSPELPLLLKSIKRSFFSSGFFIRNVTV